MLLFLNELCLSPTYSEVNFLSCCDFILLVVVVRVCIICIAGNTVIILGIDNRFCVSVVRTDVFVVIINMFVFECFLFVNASVAGVVIIIVIVVVIIVHNDNVVVFVVVVIISLLVVILLLGIRNTRFHMYIIITDVVVIVIEGLFAFVLFLSFAGVVAFSPSLLVLHLLMIMLLLS